MFTAVGTYHNSYYVCVKGEVTQNEVFRGNMSEHLNCSLILHSGQLTGIPASCMLIRKDSHLDKLEV